MEIHPFAQACICIFKKLFSGRYLILIAVMGTYCHIVDKCLYLVQIDKMGLDVFLGLFAGLSGIAGTIVTSYFNRTDRKVIDEEEMPKKGV